MSSALRGVTYLASPYSHGEAEVMRERYEAAVLAAGKLFAAGELTFSPIAHSHPIAESADLLTSWAGWQAFDLLMLHRCDRLAVLMLDGWEKSYGVAAEMKRAEELGMPIRFIEP